MTNKDESLQVLAHMLEVVLKNMYGMEVCFALLVFPTGCYNADYISNAKRGDMIEALKETQERLVRGEDIPPTIGGTQ